MKTTGKDVLYPELSYTIIGVLFEVFNELGFGHKEKYYEEAIAVSLTEKSVPFKRQLYSPVMFQGKQIGKYFFDFLIDGKIVLELKVGNQFVARKHIDQIYSYLKSNKLQLGIIAQFTAKEVKSKRVVNIIDS